jgi:hypothetical protein
MDDITITIDVREKYLNTDCIESGCAAIGYYSDFKGVTLTLKQVNSNLFIITKKEPLVPTKVERQRSYPCLGIIHTDDECSLIYKAFGETEEDEQEFLGIVRAVKWNNVNIYLKNTFFEIINGKKCVCNRYNFENRPIIIEYGYIEAQNIESVKEALSHVWMVEYDPLDI